MATGIAVDRPAFTWEACLASEAQGLLSQGPERWLGPAERAIFAGLKVPKRRRDWLVGRVAAKRALRSELGPSWAFPEMEILNEEDGRPYARTPAGRIENFSISHCAAGGVCALARGPGRVGVDFEPVAARSPAVLALFAHPSETAPRGEAPALWQTKLWTAKEAVLKLLGLGLSCDPREVRWRAAAKRLELDGLARRRWLGLGSPRIAVRHLDFEDALIAFANSAGD